MKKIKQYFGGIIIAAIIIMYFCGAIEFSRELHKDSDLKQQREQVKFQKDSLQAEWYKQQLKAK
jgi:cell division protein FtsL